MKNSVSRQSPLVSVLMPAYNAGPYLCPALKSVLNQTYTNLEVILVNDGSTDDSLDTIAEITDERLIIINQENAGKAVALNVALDIKKGQYWLIQDADDLSRFDRIEMLLRELEDNLELAAVYSGHDLLIRDRQFAPTNSAMTKSQCRDEIARFRLPAHDATGMYRTAMVESQRFDPKLKIGQGVDFVLRTGENYAVTRLNKCLYTYRINFQSTIRKNPCNNVKWTNLVLEKACFRRGIDFSTYCIKETAVASVQLNTNLNHIVPHCVSSVVDQKKERFLLSAICTGVTCLKIAPGTAAFYKPLLFSLFPVTFIHIYRIVKSRFLS